jgi:hypothetical protein
MQATSEATLPVTSPRSMPVTKKDLPSLFPAIPFTVVRFTVGPDGAIDMPPGSFLAGLEEVVSWVITNASTKQITVALTKFMKKAHYKASQAEHQAEDYFEWLGGRMLNLNDGQTGRLYGRVKRGPDNPIDSLSYTIEVRSTDHTSFAFDYDPDGDIKP